MKHLYIHKIPFIKRILLDHRVKWLNFKTGHLAPRREENIVEFLEGRFCNQKLSFIVHKKETENSFEFSLTICVF